jgi:hypothetical protein
MVGPTSGSLVFGTSGGTGIIPNPTGALKATFEQLFTGTAPSTCSVTIQGQMAGGTKDAASNTNTTVTATVTQVTFAKNYGGFLVTPTWTGGDATTKFTINWVIGPQ